MLQRLFFLHSVASFSKRIKQSTNQFLESIYLLRSNDLVTWHHLSWQVITPPAVTWEFTSGLTSTLFSLQNGLKLKNTRFNLPVKVKWWCHPSPTEIFHWEEKEKTKLFLQNLHIKLLQVRDGKNIASLCKLRLTPMPWDNAESIKRKKLLKKILIHLASKLCEKKLHVVLYFHAWYISMNAKTLCI